MCIVAGISADANILIDEARVLCQRYEYRYGGDPMPVEQLVQAICNIKHEYTQNGGQRPFGVAFVFAGWDRIYGFQVYQTDPSGNYSGWKATCIGNNSSTAHSIFKSDYPDPEKNEHLDMQSANKLLVKVLEKTMEATTLDGDKRTFATSHSLID